MEEPVKDKLMIISQLLQELVPEELEPRLELQVFVDPLGALAVDDNNNNNNNNGPNNNNNNNNNEPIMD